MAAQVMRAGLEYRTGPYWIARRLSVRSALPVFRRPTAHSVPSGMAVYSSFGAGCTSNVPSVQELSRTSSGTPCGSFVPVFGHTRQR